MNQTSTALDLTQIRDLTHSFQRKDLKSLTVADRGIMPEGFEVLKPEELSAVVEYLSRSKVKP